MAHDPDEVGSSDSHVAATKNGEQLDIFDAAGKAAAEGELLATMLAFAAPFASNVGAVVKDPNLVQLAVEVLAVYADYHSRNGLSFAQLQAGLQRRIPRLASAVIEARLEHLHRAGFLESYLPKLHQGRYVVRPAGLVGALSADRLLERGGVDDLVLLLNRALSASEANNPDPRKVWAHFQSCRHGLLVFALDLERRVASGTVAELMEAGRQHDHSGFTHQVVRLNEVVTARFPGNHDLEEAGAALIEAEQFYREQVRGAIAKVLAQGGAGLNFDVLAPGEYEDAAVEADLDRLAEVGRGLLSDSPGIHVDVDLLVEALDTYEPRTRVRTRPEDTMVYLDELDPLAAMDTAREEVRRHRRLGLEAQLGTASEADLTFVMQGSWASAIDFLVGALALDADAEEPFVLDLSEVLFIDSVAPVTYLHPARLIRTDLAAPNQPGRETAILAEEQDEP